jgi:hypothetical protein
MQLHLTHRPLFPEWEGLPRALEDHYDGVLRSRPRESATAYRYKTSIAR